jgi:hypothetical protein
MPRTRMKRIGWGLVIMAVLGGAAYAAFQNEESKGGGSVTSGSLRSQVDGLPLDFKDAAGNQQVLYPTTSDGKEGFISDTFTVTNPNKVSVSYSIWAICKSTTCTSGTDQNVQYQQLWIDVAPEGRFAHAPTESAAPSVPNVLGQAEGATAPAPFVYHGKLADLMQIKAAALGTLDPNIAKTFVVKLWLKQDPNAAQKQNVTSEWDFKLATRTV